MPGMKKIIWSAVVLITLVFVCGGAWAEVKVTSKGGEEFTVEVNAVNIARIEYNPGMMIYTFAGAVLPVNVVAADVVKIEFVTAASGLRYNLVARHSGKCLDINGSSLDDGAQLLQWDCSGAANQIFTMVPAGGEWYQIVAAHSNKCLDVDTSEDTHHNGARVRQMPCSGEANQQFKLEDAGDGYVKIKAKHSELVLDVFGKSTENGAEVVQWTDGRSSNQSFELRQVATE
jgi:hypothetical protein